MKDNKQNAPAGPQRTPSVLFAPTVDTTNAPFKPSITRARSTSHTIPITSDNKRNHSASISSVCSTESKNDDHLNRLIENDTRTATNASRDAYKGKIKLMDDVDLEKQMIITAGGKREYVMGFVCKLLFLMTIVFGCGVLVFYAL